MKKKNINYYDKDILRFTVAGNIDDGKSTLIGRLLFENGAIFEDQLEQIKLTCEKKGIDYIDLSLLTDGLKAEREQGITIDVAYRYFSTEKRKFIISDNPGHFQYTRNMITGSSNTEAIILLVDILNGITEQTLRHLFIASILNIHHIIICINKIDLINYDSDKFNSLCNKLSPYLSRIGYEDVKYIPISALHGDNITQSSPNTLWYKGATLLDLLNNIKINKDKSLREFRLPIQYVIRNTSNRSRGYTGRIDGGAIKVRDRVKILPSGYNSTVKSINIFNHSLKKAISNQSVTLFLEDELDISRGNMIVKENYLPNITQRLDLIICWMSQNAVNMHEKYLLRHTTNEVMCSIDNIKYKIDPSSLEENSMDLNIKTNDIARITVSTTVPIMCDNFKDNQRTGSIILINKTTNETVAAGTIL